MKTTMHILQKLILIISIVVMLNACVDTNESDEHAHGKVSHETEEQIEKGAHGGRLLENGSFELELAIVEAGVPPEFRVWLKENGSPIDPNEIDLQITLTRLGGDIDEIHFNPQDEYLRGDTEIYEPHSFIVSVIAKYQEQTHKWQYENFEGRTKISPDVAAAFDLETSIAGPEKISESITVYGQIEANPEYVRNVSARFDGVIRNVEISIGDTVTAGQTLAKVESNESLSIYSIKAPINGVVIERNANAGEQTNSRELFTIVNTSFVWANLMLFPKDRAKVKRGDEAVITTAIDGKVLTGKISNINIVTDANQAVVARVILENEEGQLIPGTYITAQINFASYEVPLAVKRSGLQSFRDFTVVYAQIGDEYEVRMLEVGRQDDQWVEVLGGLKPGTSYVSKNSYLVKADIEKSGATHDH